MKKPSVSYSKKGAIFNILWLLVENPKGLKYYRQVDIKNQLKEEFGIILDKKTVQDYIDILIELDLGFEISHEANKGYYISKRIITNQQRILLIDCLFDQKGLDLETKINLLNFITYDCSSEDKHNIYSHSPHFTNDNFNNHINLIKNIEIIEQAIKEERSITFDYLNYNKYGKLMKEARTYEVIPKKIKYINGMYYLYNADTFWANVYSGIKIKYMRNIKLGDYQPNPKYHEKFNFTFEVYILYEWSIEFIVDHFDDYKIIREKNGMKAIINAPFEFALDWCKKYAIFFIIDNEELKNHTLKDMQLLISNYNNNNSVFVFKVKSAIVDYHYKNPINKDLNYDSYMKGLYKEINFRISTLGYKLKDDSEIKVYTNGEDNLSISYIECNKNKQSIYSLIHESFQKLKEKNTSKKIIVVFYDDIDDYEKKKIKELLKFDPFVDYHNKFSNCNKAYFYQYLVFEI